MCDHFLFLVVFVPDLPHSQHRQTWFTYSYCHNHEIRQFKELPHNHPHAQGIVHFYFHLYLGFQTQLGTYEPTEDPEVSLSHDYPVVVLSPSSGRRSHWVVRLPLQKLMRRWL